MARARGKKAIGLTLVALALGGAGFAVYKLMTKPKPPTPTMPTTPAVLTPNQQRQKFLQEMNINRPAFAQTIIEQFFTKGRS